MAGAPVAQQKGSGLMRPTWWWEFCEWVEEGILREHSTELVRVESDIFWSLEWASVDRPTHHSLGVSLNIPR